MKRERDYLLSVGTSEGRCAPFSALGHGEVLHALLLHHLLLLLLLHLSRMRVCPKEVSKTTDLDE